jgi:hypothetical protein
MEVLVLRDAERFAELAGPWMAADPYSTNVIGARLAIACVWDQPRREDDIWVAVFEGGEVAGVAMHTPPHNLFLPRLKSGIPAQIALALAKSGRTLPGVTGEVGSVDEFVRTWARQTGTVSRLSHALRMYPFGRRYPSPKCAGAAPPAQVVLYADLANPTSNSIYQNIGYLPDHDAEERSFVQGTG